MIQPEYRYARQYRFILTCQKCGCEFKSFKSDRKYCDKHRWTDRTRPKIEKVCSVCGKKYMGYGKKTICSVECRSKKDQQQKLARKIASGWTPRQPKPPKPKKIKMKTPTMPKIKPRIADKIEVIKPIPPAPTVYKRVQTGPKTWIEFSTPERYEKWINGQTARNVG